MFRRGIDPPLWWRPWLVPYYTVRDWWYRPRPVKVKSGSEEGRHRG